MYNENNVAPLLHLDPWDCYRHILTSFSLEASGYGLLTFANHERLLILIKNKELANDIQQHVGSIITIQRTEDPDNEWLYFFNDNNRKEYISKPEQNLQPVPISPITEDANNSKVESLILGGEVVGVLQEVTLEGSSCLVTSAEGMKVHLAQPKQETVLGHKGAIGNRTGILSTDIAEKEYLFETKRKEKTDIQSGNIHCILTKDGNKKRSLNVKLTKRNYTNNHEYLTRNQRTLFGESKKRYTNE